VVPVHRLFFNPELWKQRIWRAESPINHTDSFTKTLLHYAIRKANPKVDAVMTGTGSDQFNGGLVRWMVNDAEQGEDNWENFHKEIIDTENHKLVSRDDEALWGRRNFINREFLLSICDKKVEKNSWMFYVDGALHSQTYSLLWDEVRASGYHGHTTRFPFLDSRFLPFISKIPPRLHKELFFDKAILRTGLKGILPDYVISKPKVPSSIPHYDFRFDLFKFITEKDSRQIVEEALADITQPHSVIDKKELVKRLTKMQKEPEIAEWINIMHIINLGLLEKLPYKTEHDMDMESSIGELQEVPFDDPEKTKVFLDKALSVKKIDLQQPLVFSEGASLLFNKLDNKYFLSKDNKLKFEIEEEYRDWINFLNAIDNRRSIQQILDELKIEYAKIEEFLNMSVEERILTTEETAMK
jgi:asparagine synthase (glutamine-hydrolysing)